MTESQIRIAHSKLEGTGESSIKIEQQIYRRKPFKMGQNDYFFANRRTTSEQQTNNNRTQYKNVNNLKNVKNIPRARARENE